MKAGTWNIMLLAGSALAWYKWIRPLKGIYYVPLTIGEFFLVGKLLRTTATTRFEELNTANRQQITVNDNGTPHTITIYN